MLRSRQEHDRSAASGGTQRPARHGIGWLLLSPLIAWAVAFVVAPAVIMLVYSFAHRGTLGGVVLGFTLENYAGVLDPVYMQIVIRSIVYAAITTVLCLRDGLPGRVPDRPLRRAAAATPC